MEQHSRTEDTPQSRGILEGLLRESFGRVVYTHKTHEKCADILLSRLNMIRLWQIALSAITTGGLIVGVLGKNEIGNIVGLVVSTILLALNAYTKDNDDGALAQKHRKTGSDLWLIRERLCSLLGDVAMKEKPLEMLQQQRDELVEQLHAVYAGAPSTNSKAYKKAQEALQQNEDMTFSDSEIDAFLPKELKRSSRPELKHPIVDQILSEKPPAKG